MTLRKKSCFTLCLMVIFLLTASSIFAKKSKKEDLGNIIIAVWGFQYMDSGSRTMVNYLPRDFAELSAENDEVRIIDAKTIKKALKGKSVEDLDPETVTTISTPLGVDVNIWGQISQIEPTLYKVGYFLSDMQSGEVKFEHMQMPKKKDERITYVAKIIDQAINIKRMAENKAKEIALNFFHAEQYTDAQKAFQELLRLNPKEKIAYNYLAYIDALNEDYVAAVDHYLKAVEIDPEYIEALEGLAWAYRATEQYDNARDTYERLANIENGDCAKYLFCVGEVCQIQEDFEGAVAAYEEILEKDDTCVDAHKALGILYFDNDFFDEAISHLKAVVDAGIESDDVGKKLAIAFQKTGRIDESIQQNLELIEKNPEIPAPYLNVAAIYVTQQRFDEALDALKKYITLKPEVPTGYNRISDVYRQIKDYSAAIANAKKSATLNPEAPEPYLLLAEIDNSRGYNHYQLFIQYDEKAKNPDLGAEYESNNKLRGENKKQAQAFFVSARDYYKEAEKFTSDFMMKERLKEKFELINKLIEETKFDPFYDE